MTQARPAHYVQGPAESPPARCGIDKASSDEYVSLNRAARELRVPLGDLLQALEEYGFTRDLRQALDRPLSIRRSDLAGLRERFATTRQVDGVA